MQKYKEINGNDYVKNSRTTINETMQSIQSMNSGTAFPTNNLFEGMKCYRTDLKKTYTLTDVENNTWVEDAHAELADEATHAASATKLRTPRALNLSGAVTADAATFDGTANATINVKTLDATKLKGTASVSTTGNAATATKVVATAAAGASANIAEATMASSDSARIRVSGATNAGELALETADDGSEPIVARQYTGAYTNAVRTAKILDESGNTSFPGTVVAPKFTGALNGNAATATKLSTERKINITGNATGSAGFDGTSDVNINVTVNSATKATNDGNGANIASTYVKKEGDTTTGKITFASTDLNALPEVKKTSDDNMSGIRFSSKSKFLGAVGKRLSNGEDLLNLRSDNTSTDIVLDSRNYGNYALPKRGGTMTGALNFANSTWNTIGGDSYMGDHDISGTFCVKGANGETGIALVNKGNENDYARISYGGGNINFNKTIGGNISGNSATATKLATARAISLTGNASGSANFDGSGNVSINTTVSQAAKAGRVNIQGRRANLASGQSPNAGLEIFQVYMDAGYPQQYGNVLSIGGLGDNEFFLGWQDDMRPYYRSKRDTSNDWTDWKALAYISDINSFAPTNTGGGASGTWGINISGNAASATTATKANTASSVAWSGVTGKPGTYPPSAHNHDSAYPSVTGTRASGTWGINISGNAASATNADKLDGYHASDIIGKIQDITPKTAAAIGQFRELVVNDSHQVKLPDGGTWAYFCYTYNSWNGGDSNGEQRTRTGAGIAAGGTVIHTDDSITSNTINAFKLSGTTGAGGADGNTIIVGGFCWRIA